MSYLATLNLEGNLIISNNGKPINSISSSELKKLKEIFMEIYGANYIKMINGLLEYIKPNKTVYTIKKMINDYESKQIAEDL